MLLRRRNNAHVSFFETAGIERIQIVCRDNGKGFDAEGLTANERGMGLYNIQKRSGIIGGDLSVASKPGKGTSVTIVVPYP